MNLPPKLPKAKLVLSCANLIKKLQLLWMSEPQTYEWLAGRLAAGWLQAAWLVAGWLQAGWLAVGCGGVSIGQEGLGRGQ